MSGQPWLGIIADDFTGACDVADAVSERGGSVIVTVGVPGEPPPDCDCLVVALKSRTAPRAAAVAESVAAARWLLSSGCTILYQKYCSTFDSTDDGNIGPVAEALARLLAVSPHAAPSRRVISIGTPATPRSGRTVYQGHLFVGRQLLSDSPLKDHPLTPMRNADLVAVLAAQTTGPVDLIAWPVVSGGATAVAAAVDSSYRHGAHHLILDSISDDDLHNAAEAILRREADGSRFVVGGAAGLAGALAGVGPASRAGQRVVPPVPEGRRLILSGSCSAATRRQVAAFPGPRIELSPLDLAADRGRTLNAILSTLDGAFAAADAPVLVSSSADPEAVREYKSRLGDDRCAALLEAATAEIAARAVESFGVRRLLVAGGETSGAVVQGLGVGTLHIGPAAGPGLPWMVPASGPRLALLLKSGNFGDADLFTAAWNSCP